MGDEITQRYFDAEDFSRFRARLDQETDLLRERFDRDAFSTRGNVAGFELEAWLVDAAGDPLPDNAHYLECLHNPLVVPELAAFNVELNGSPTELSGRVYTRLHEELKRTWGACAEASRSIDSDLLCIGILPTLCEPMLSTQYMSAVTRYRSLNDRVMALRDGRPLQIVIDGDTPLSTMHTDVMMEAATTSFQIHLQVLPQHAARDFNASLAVSAATVAVSANSPFLFGHALWEETRIPLFEQSVDVGDHSPSRVSFGHGYVHASLFEIFRRNQQNHPILVPAVLDTPPERFGHVRFHNGTVWRWNRPLIGFDDDGEPHLRIEHRVVPAGPTLIDCIANAAFYHGLVAGLRLRPTPVEQQLPFERARENFYAAARYGLNARIAWPSGSASREHPIRSLLMDELLPLAREGLLSHGIPADEADRYLDVIGARVDSSQNGAAWQRRWIAANGADFHGLVQAYRALQQRDEPVHEWPL